MDLIIAQELEVVQRQNASLDALIAALQHRNQQVTVLKQEIEAWHHQYHVLMSLYKTPRPPTIPTDDRPRFMRRYGQ